MESKIGVVVLGATGSVGQKFIELLDGHPWFDVVGLGASERSAGKKYCDATNWFLSAELPEWAGEMVVKKCDPSEFLGGDVEPRIVFSGLDAAVAGEIEEDFAKAGFVVVSNSKNHRFDSDVPLLVPEVNSGHLELVGRQKWGESGGAIVTNPNCSTVGLTMALKPLVDAFGVEAVNVVTMQALSGAGYPGVSSLDVLDNVVPFIGGEEEKMAKEPLKIFGELADGGVKDIDMKISATCNRVAVVDGHMECVSVKFSQSEDGGRPSLDDVIRVWDNFQGEPQELGLPMAPEQPVKYFYEDNFPQPRKHRGLGRGMVVSVGRLRECPLFDVKFVVLVHNTVRGAAGGAILNAELMVKRGLV